MLLLSVFTVFEFRYRRKNTIPYLEEEYHSLSIYLGSHTAEYEVDSEMVSNRFQSKRVAVCSRRVSHDFKKVAS